VWHHYRWWWHERSSMKASSSYENFVPCCKHYNIFTIEVLHKRWDNKTWHLFQQIWVQDLSHAAELGNQKQNLSLGQAISAKLQSITLRCTWKYRITAMHPVFCNTNVHPGKWRRRLQMQWWRHPEQRNIGIYNDWQTSKAEKKTKLIDCGTFHH